MSSSAAEMKMCSSSVAPIPSMILTPVAACQARQVSAGSVSPAETQRRSVLEARVTGRLPDAVA